jgi:hypothetical protein
MVNLVRTAVFARITPSNHVERAPTKGSTLRSATGSRVLVFVLLGQLVSAGLCKGVDPLVPTADRAVTVLDTAIANVTAESSAYRNALERALRDLPQEVQSTIRVELQQLLDHTVAQGGVEIRCNADFIGRRVVQGLRAIRAELKHEPSVAALPPAVCHITPSALDLGAAPGRRDSVEFVGFDFDARDARGRPAQVELVSSSNCTVEVPPQYVSRASHYQITVNTSFTNGVPFDGRSAKLRITWNGRPMEQGEVQLTQPSPGVRRTFSAPIRQFPYSPPHTEGDEDFKGHGPAVNVRATARQSGNSVLIQLCMTARETRADWTTARGCMTPQVAYTAAGDERLVRIVSDVDTEWRYVDTNHDVDRQSFPSGELVRMFEVVGDQRGDDASHGTSVTAYFNHMQVELERLPRPVTAPGRSPLVCARPG